MSQPDAAVSALPARQRREIAESGAVLAESTASDYEPTMLVRRASSAKQAYLRVMDERRFGERIELNKVITAVGRPGDCLVTCIRRLDEVAVRFTEGETAARLNGNLLTEIPVLMNVGDLLEVGSTRFQFWIGTA